MALQAKIKKKFSGFTLDVEFETKEGCMGILGASGCGKSMTLKCIAGIEKPDSGKIVLNGRVLFDSEKKINLPVQKRNVGYLFQNYALFNHMTVAENIAFGLQVQKADKKKIQQRTEMLAELVGLANFIHRYPMQLSGGQRQRVAFARALAPEPQLLLLDEPFAAIDAKVRKDLRQWLRSMIHQLGITSIFVTHDQDEAVEVADDIIITNKGHVEL